MSERPLKIKDLYLEIGRALSLRKGDSVELQLDKTDKNRMLIVRHPREAADD